MSCKEIKIIVTSGFRHFVRICSYLLDAVTTIVMHQALLFCWICIRWTQKTRCSFYCTHNWTVLWKMAIIGFKFHHLGLESLLHAKSWIRLSITWFLVCLTELWKWRLGFAALTYHGRGWRYNPSPLRALDTFVALAPVVQTLDIAIHRINHYPAD